MSICESVATEEVLTTGKIPETQPLIGVLGMMS